MRLRNIVPIALLAVLAATTAVHPVAPAAAAAGGPIDAVRVAAPSEPRWLRKLLDYVACTGAIVLIKDPGAALGAVAACGNALKTWYEE